MALDRVVNVLLKVTGQADGSVKKAAKESADAIEGAGEKAAATTSDYLAQIMGAVGGGILGGRIGGALTDLGRLFGSVLGAEVAGAIAGGKRDAGKGKFGGIHEAMPADAEFPEALPGGRGARADLAASAGPVGMAVAVGLKLQQIVNDIAKSPAHAAAAGIDAVTNALKELGGPLGPLGVMLSATEGVGAGLEKVGDALGQFGLPLSVAGDAIESVTGSFRDLTMVVVGLAGKANPAHLRRWQMALDDVQAVVGHRLVPILDRMTQGVRLIGDVLNTILPDVGEVQAALSVLDPVFANLKDMLTDLAPLLREAFSQSLVYLAAALYAVTIPIQGLINILDALGLQIMELLGIKPGTGLKSSFGAAPGPASTVGISDIGRRVRESAFSSGMAPAAERSAGSLEKIREYTERIDRFVRDIYLFITTAPQVAAEAGAGRVAGSSIGAVGGGGAIDAIIRDIARIVSRGGWRNDPRRVP